MRALSFVFWGSDNCVNMDGKMVVILKKGQALLTAR